MRIPARVVDCALEPRFKELMLEEKWYVAARHAYALAISHWLRQNYKIADRWGRICLQLLRLCALTDWERDTSPIVLGGIEVPAPLYPGLVKKNLPWLKSDGRERQT